MVVVIADWPSEKVCSALIPARNGPQSKSNDGVSEGSSLEVSGRVSEVVEDSTADVVVLL